MNPGAGDLLGAWQLNGALLVTLALVCVYAAGVRRYLKTEPGSVFRKWPAWRSAAFGVGCGFVAVALCSGIDAWADRLLSVHMAQHLVLMFAAAPLLVLGAPIRLLLGSAPRSTGRAVTRLASGPFGLLVHPVVAGAVFALAGLVLHVPGVYDAAARSDWIHVLLHAGFLLTALLFWTPLLAPEPIAHRMSAMGKLAYLILAMPAMAVVGVVLNSSADAIYAAYPDVADQQLAGALMWIGGGSVIGAAFLLCGWHALVAEERRAVAREARGGRA